MVVQMHTAKAAQKQSGLYTIKRVRNQEQVGALEREIT